MGLGLRGLTLPQFEAGRIPTPALLPHYVAADFGDSTLMGCKLEQLLGQVIGGGTILQGCVAEEELLGERAPEAACARHDMAQLWGQRGIGCCMSCLVLHSNSVPDPPFDHYRRWQVRECRQRDAKVATQRNKAPRGWRLSEPQESGCCMYCEDAGQRRENEGWV